MSDTTENKLSVAMHLSIWTQTSMDISIRFHQ